MKVTSRDGGANTYFMRARARVCVWCACVRGWVLGLGGELGRYAWRSKSHTPGPHKRCEDRFVLPKNLDCFASVASVMKELTLFQP